MSFGRSFGFGRLVRPASYSNVSTTPLSTVRQVLHLLRYCTATQSTLIVRYILTDQPNAGQSSTVYKYLKNLRTAQSTLVEAAAERQYKSVLARLAKAPDNPTFFNVGQLVLVKPRGSQMRPKVDVK